MSKPLCVYRLSSPQHQRRERVALPLLSVCSAVVAVPVGLIQCSSPPAIPGGAVGQCLSFRRRERERVCHNFTQMKLSGMIVVWLPASPSIMTLPDHMIYYYYYWELLYSLNVSPVWVIFPFCPPPNKKKKNLICRLTANLPSEVVVVFIVVGNSPAAISIKTLILGRLFAQSCRISSVLRCMSEQRIKRTLSQGQIEIGTISSWGIMGSAVRLRRQ